MPIPDSDPASTAPMTPLSGARPIEPTRDSLPAQSDLAAGATASDRMVALLDREELRGERVRLWRAIYLGCFVWVAFILTDVVDVFVLEATRLEVALPIRLIPLVPGILALIYLRRQRRPSRAVLRVIEVGVYGLAGFTLGLLSATHDHGLLSPHAVGSVLMVLSHGVMLGSPWRRALLPILVATFSPVAVLGLAAIFDERLAAQWQDPEVLGRAMPYVSMSIGAIAVTLVGGNLVWGLRQQVAESRSIGRYQLRRRIAAGGMGEVWAAYHVGLKRDVAVKLIRPERVGRDEHAAARFEREVQATGELVHPNTVRIFDYGVTDDGIWYYAMELIEGESLEALVEREGPLEPRRALRLVTQAAQALGEAHRRGIVHRDVKPANILLVRGTGGDEYVKLIDFGIARLADEEGLTKTGMVVGTPGYIAPEVITGGLATPRSDVYALGTVLFYLLTGVGPFHAETPDALIRLPLIEDPASPSKKLGAELPGGVEALVLRCLARDPAGRFADGDALARAIRELG